MPKDQNQTKPSSELHINLQQFEELAEKFCEDQDTRNFDTITSDKIQSEKWIEKFKQFVFVIQPSRKEEYFKLKEQLKEMQAEFEPEFIKVDEVNLCSGCYFNSTDGECNRPSDFEKGCNKHSYIWIKA